MTDLLPLLAVGITTGSVYGLAALGLVLTYKTSGIFNFAHGSLGAVAAFAFYELHTVRGLPGPIALVIAVVLLPPVLGLVLERLTRVLSGGSVTTRIVATTGLQLAIVSALIAHYGAEGLDFPTFLPTETVQVAGVFVGLDQLISAAIAAVGALGFFLFFRFSVMGVRMRAVVDNAELLSLAGTNLVAVRRWAWVIGTWVAAVSGVLLAPQIGLDALLLTLLVVQAYGAAAIGLFSSLPLTYAGGLLIGVIAALTTNFVAGSAALAGLPPAVPFLVLFAVLLLVRRGKLVDGATQTSPPVSTPLLSRRGALLAGLFVVAAAALLPLVVDTRLPIYANALVFVLIFYSLHLLVRVSGQVSLTHAGLVAVGSAAFSHLTVGAGLPWLAAVLVAGLIAVPIGAVIAIPAIRLAGLFLALATYGFGLLLEKVFYRTDLMFGGDGTLPATRPTMFDSDTAFYYVLLAFAVAGTGLVAIIGHSRLGRLLRAMADSPTTLSTLGLGLNVTRVTVFGISAFIAGIAGALYAAHGHSATGVPFSSHASLTWLAVLVMCGVARSAAPVAAAALLVVVPAYVANETLIEWLPVLFGLGALLVARYEASASRVRAAATATLNAPDSRASQRRGANSPFAVRVRTAAPLRRNRAAPTRVRLGAGIGGTTR